MPSKEEALGSAGAFSPPPSRRPDPGKLAGRWWWSGEKDVPSRGSAVHGRAGRCGCLTKVGSS